MSGRLLCHTVVVKELRLNGICRLEVGWSKSVSSCQLRHSASVIQRAVALFEVGKVGRGEDFAHLFISMEKATRADGWPGPGHSCIADSSAGSGPAWSSLTAARQLAFPWWTHCLASIDESKRKVLHMDIVQQEEIQLHTLPE